MKIAFAHNVFNRFKTLKDTIDIERFYFPNSKVFIACNSYENNIFFNSIENINYAYYLNTPQHKIGCCNGLIISCLESLKDDYDVLIFSHDDVRINPDYYHIFEENLNQVIDGKYDLIYRNPKWIGDDYAMFEALIMNRKTVETLFKDLQLLTDESQIGTHGGSISPEHWFYKLLYNKNLKTKVIKYPDLGIKEYNKIMSEGIGFEHLNAGLRGWTD